MGLIQSCLGKKSNKVGVMSEEEEEAYDKKEDEMRKEIEDNIIHTKPLPWLMFCTELGTTKADNSDQGGTGTATELVQKKGGVAFTVEYKSSVPKLPPINVKRYPKTPPGEDYDKWKEERDSQLVDKHEQARTRRDIIIHERIKSARRPSTARARTLAGVVSLIE